MSCINDQYCLSCHSFKPRRSLVRSQYRPPGQRLCRSPSRSLLGAIPVTVSTQREALEPLIGVIGAVPLREFSAATVRSAHLPMSTCRARYASMGIPRRRSTGALGMPRMAVEVLRKHLERQAAARMARTGATARCAAVRTLLALPAVRRSGEVPRLVVTIVTPSPLSCFQVMAGRLLHYLPASAAARLATHATRILSLAAGYARDSASLKESPVAQHHGLKQLQGSGEVVGPVAY